MTDKPVFFVIGNTRGGKTTLGRILAGLTGGWFCDTSSVIKRDYAKKIGVTVDRLNEWLGTEHRAQGIRKHLYDYAVEQCEAADNPAWYVQCAIEQCGATVVGGIRRQEELEAARSIYPEAIVVWIERGKPDETDYVDGRDADYTIDNRQDTVVVKQYLTAEAMRILRAIAVKAGLDDIRAGRVSDGPDLDAGDRLAASIEETAK